MSVRDRVIVIFAVAIGASIVVVIVGLVLVRLDDPHADLGAAESTVSGLVTAMAGFVAGSLRRDGGE